MGWIYRLENTKNGKNYIGKFSGKNLQAYLRGCFSQAINFNSNNKPYLYNALRHHGENAFTVHILEEGKTGEDLSQREIFHIAAFKSNNPEFGYNLTLGGDGCNRVGWKHSEATIQKIRDQKKAFYASEDSKEARRLMREAKQGKTLSTEHREKIGKSLEGRQVSDETRKLLREKVSGLNNGMFGKTGELNPMFHRRGKDHPSHGKARPDQRKRLSSMKRDEKGRLLPKESTDDQETNYHTPL